MLVVATAVAGLMAYYRQDIAYLLVLIWAFIGIGVEQSDTPQVANAAYLAAAIVAIFVILVIIQKFRQKSQASNGCIIILYRSKR